MALPRETPFTDIQAVVPADGADLPGGVCRALLISVGGTLKVNNAQGVTRAVTVPAGKIDLQVQRVWASGTAATGISALY